MALYTEDYHANEGTYADDVPQAGVVWLVTAYRIGSDYKWTIGIYQPLAGAVRGLQAFADKQTGVWGFDKAASHPDGAWCVYGWIAGAGDVQQKWFGEIERYKVQS